VEKQKDSLSENSPLLLRIPGEHRLS